ncbi:FAM126 [Mytilus edulis]|uniref:FAM126 n=1 Tax=Mytilus edulis TaxID=6550 RepID=A0A8S3R8M4_MYTED|nr:FAM126 [Mytilus edulis]
MSKTDFLSLDDNDTDPIVDSDDDFVLATDKKKLKYGRSSQAIREWLTEYKTLSPEELNTYSSTVRHNDELVSCLYHLFKSETDSQVLDPICHQLFEFYRSNQPGLRLFALEFIPTLQWVYLSSLSVNGKSVNGIKVSLYQHYNGFICLLSVLMVKGKFIPTLQWVYLSSLSVNGKKSCGGVEALLLAAYNLVCNVS